MKKILKRLFFALQMFPTKNLNSLENQLRVQSTAYPDGTKFEYLNGIKINDLKRKKVKI